MQQHQENVSLPLEFGQQLPSSLDTTRGTIGLLGVGPDDSDPPVEEILEHIDPYIIAQVEKILAGSPDIAPRMERDELAQRVRINLWHSQQARPIRNIKAYVRRIVHNEFVNVLRGREPPLPLPMTEDGELLECTMPGSSGEDMLTPESELEQKETVIYLADEAAAAISTLPPRQKDAMTALLYERLDNLILVVDSFKQFDMDIEAARWPAEEDEKRLLKSSISAARRSVARSLDVDQKLYKKKGASFFHLK